jgi:alpha-glucoside transport system substrate-binding protein
VSVAGLEYDGGIDAYASAVPLEEAGVVIGLPFTVEAQTPQWQLALDATSKQYGIRYRFQQFPLQLTVSEAASQGLHADIYIMVGGAEVRDLAAARPLLDLRAFVDEAQLLDDYGSYLVSLGRIADDGTWPSDTGPIHGVFVGVNSKALVWTKEPEFTNLGYRPPSDWTSYMALAEEIVADGRTPFCLELMSGGAGDGWPVTDWVEMVVLRTAGPDFYESWIRHEVPFDDPVVVEAIRTIGEMVHRPGFLDATPAAMTLRDFGDALFAFTEQPGACLMTPFPSFLPGVLGADTELPVGSFAFPNFGAGFDDAVVGGGDIAVAVTDRPEVRALMAALASPDWDIGVSQLHWPLPMPANARFDVTRTANPEVAEIVAAIQDAIRADGFRFDASDAMPPEIQDVFLGGMVRLVREGSLETLDELSLDIARDVEAAWLELEESAE